MSERVLCEERLPKTAPTMPNMIAICARPPGHDGDHCSVLHKPFGQLDCPRCAPLGGGR